MSVHSCPGIQQGKIIFYCPRVTTPHGEILWAQPSTSLNYRYYVRIPGAGDTWLVPGIERLGISFMRFLYSPSTTNTSLKLQTPKGDRAKRRDHTKTKRIQPPRVNKLTHMLSALCQQLTLRLSFCFTSLFLPVCTTVNTDRLHARFVTLAHQTRLSRSSFWSSSTNVTPWSR